MQSIKSWIRAAGLLGSAFAIAAPAFADHKLGALPPTVTVMPAPPKAGAPALPASVDLRQWSVVIGDQGAVGSCVAWTIAHDMFGWYANRASMNTKLYAPMYLYSQINVGESAGQDGGAYPTTGFNVAIAQGIDSEIDYPQGDYNWQAQPTAAQKTNAANFKLITSFTTLFSSPSGNVSTAQNAIQTALAAGQPVAIEFPVRPGFDALSPSNTLDSDYTGAIRGYHEVLAVGYDAQGLIIQNHWGTGWGSAGFGKLAWAVVNHDVVEAETAVSPTTTLQQRAQVFRMYETVLGRAPEAAGQAFWMQALASGTSLSSVASGFLNSPEYAQRFGAQVQTQTGFITLLYQNGLGRQPSSAEVQYYINVLNSGTSREVVVTYFSESPEAIGKWAGND